MAGPLARGVNNRDHKVRVISNAFGGLLAELASPQSPHYRPAAAPTVAAFGGLEVKRGVGEGGRGLEEGWRRVDTTCLLSSPPPSPPTLPPPTLQQLCAGAFCSSADFEKARRKFTHTSEWRQEAGVDGVGESAAAVVAKVLPMWTGAWVGHTLDGSPVQVGGCGGWGGGGGLTLSTSHLSPFVSECVACGRVRLETNPQPLTPHHTPNQVWRVGELRVHEFVSSFTEAEIETFYIWYMEKGLGMQRARGMKGTVEIYDLAGINLGQLHVSSLALLSRILKIGQVREGGEERSRGEGRREGEVKG